MGSHFLKEQPISPSAFGSCLFPDTRLQNQCCSHTLVTCSRGTCAVSGTRKNATACKSITGDADIIHKQMALELRKQHEMFACDQQSDSGRARKAQIYSTGREGASDAAQSRQHTLMQGRARMSQLSSADLALGDSSTPCEPGFTAANGRLTNR